MVIDTHVHPALFADICEDRERFDQRCDELSFHLMKPAGLDLLDVQNAFAKIDKMVLLPQDCSVECGRAVISNEEIKKLVNLKPDAFIGFASVDPRSKDAVEKLEYAFEILKLGGLKLNPAKLRIYPGDEIMKPLYKKCMEYNKPVIFHAGLSWEPNTLSKYAQPVNFEEVAVESPELRMCLSHFGWPWVKETVMLLIKFPNVYTDTACAYLDSPSQFFDYIFHQEFGQYWLEHNFAEKVMFGSNSPRFRPVRILHGLNSIQMKDRTRQLVYGENAIKFLGMEDR
ncbi:amidohydrolase family protein [Petroclostridium sp. X23]|uniref:amidohydrolase family protein n=1 Tax=Petroclostridium sp. X23 TaxID=3045146 RepID=UPI0024ADBD44|nr:amidohydrolase family protein [Petroclostridium sp. X23]WHH60109.1 amidohydrolase family protein [Petroclostridium sp. X23]